MLNLDNQILRNKNHADFNKEKINELLSSKKYSEEQLQQVKARLASDEEKLASVKVEYDNLTKNIDEKKSFLRLNEENLNNINAQIKSSLDKIAQAKKELLELASKISANKNQISDLVSKQHVFLARKKRLDIEKAKVNEERAITQENLDNVSAEVEKITKEFEELSRKMMAVKNDSANEALTLTQLNSEIEDSKRRLSALESQREFLDKLKSRYDDISESMNATLVLDKLPAEKVNGFVIKVKSQDDNTLQFTGEAKPIDLDAQRITELIKQTEDKILLLTSSKESKEKQVDDLNKTIAELESAVRNQEINLANKKTSQNGLVEQFNKIKDEFEIISLEISDVDKELSLIDEELLALQSRLSELENQNNSQAGLISREESSISHRSADREAMIVTVTQTKTELEALLNKFNSDESTFKMLQDAYNQDKSTLTNLQAQISDSLLRQDQLQAEILQLDNASLLADSQKQEQIQLLAVQEAGYKDATSSANEIMRSIEIKRKELDALKQQLYELQMRDKDVEFKYQSMKERINQVYKVDLDQYQGAEPAVDENTLTQEIEQLRSKVDSYGNVNLVAIEEYDELKKRYDFLTQQQSDLTTSKDSLHEAIQKINRTTRKMFLETFDKVKVEFRNYFRLLFNGGDCQIFLVNEQDPLESGIEIICRPPGKKLQNVLLLSGGEKSMSAIALIFAIFKVKPSPFCVLDEIDAALDEANVDRFGRMLQEFTGMSQFIVITHNKKTIANAGVMYGITMEESGVSKIVSVKFAQNKSTKDNQPDLAVA